MKTIQLVLSAACVVFADQLTKMLAARLLASGRSVGLASCVQIRYTRNTFRMGRFPGNRPALLLLWGATLVTLVLFIRDGYFFDHPVARIALGAALGGATSNLYDRLRRGAVIDLLKVGWWPIFNLADVGITVGAIAALWFIR